MIDRLWEDLSLGNPDKSHDLTLTMVEQCHKVTVHDPVIKLKCSQSTFFSVNLL